MTEPFEYLSKARLVYHEGYRYAHLGEVIDPVIYGVQAHCTSSMAPKKGHLWPRRLITSWLPLLAECTARLPARLGGA